MNEVNLNLTNHELTHDANQYIAQNLEPFSFHFEKAVSDAECGSYREYLEEARKLARELSDEIVKTYGNGELIVESWRNESRMENMIRVRLIQYGYIK